MGFVGLPVSIFLYWLMLHHKKNEPFPKHGILRLLIAGAVSVVLSVILAIPIDGAMSFLHLGILSDLSGWTHAVGEGAEATAAFLQNANSNVRPTFLWTLISMFFSAGLLEEGLKFLTCRIAVRKEGMIRTWMDSVIAFAVVGITFELIENIAFGMDSELIAALARALAPAHFVFGVIMGYFFGKYRVTGRKKYCWLSFLVPFLYHTVTNAFIGSMSLNHVFRVVGMAVAISHIAVSVVTVIVIFYWQKNRILDVPVQQKQEALREQAGANE